MPFFISQNLLLIGKGNLPQGLVEKKENGSQVTISTYERRKSDETSRGLAISSSGYGRICTRHHATFEITHH